jgi:hypothetical protein
MAVICYAKPSQAKPSQAKPSSKSASAWLLQLLERVTRSFGTAFGDDCLVRTSGIGDPKKAGQSVADHSAGHCQLDRGVG